MRWSTHLARSRLPNVLSRRDVCARVYGYCLAWVIYKRGLDLACRGKIRRRISRGRNVSLLSSEKPSSCVSKNKRKGLRRKGGEGRWSSSADQHRSEINALGTETDYLLRQVVEAQRKEGNHASWAERMGFSTMADCSYMFLLNLAMVYTFGMMWRRLRQEWSTEFF